MRAFYHAASMQVAFRIALLLGLSTPASACVTPTPNTPARMPNPIVSYLRGAELQCEDDAQRANIHRAFEDLATLPAAELRARRYADYQGTPGAWDLPRVLRSHFVPSNPHDAGIVDDPDAFWAAADSDEVRALAREVLRALDDPDRTNPVLVPLSP